MNKLAIIRVKRNGKVQFFYTQSREEIALYQDMADENCEVIIKVIDLASLFYQDDWKGTTMRNFIFLLLLLVTALQAEQSRFICTAPDGREVWTDRFQGYGKAVIVVWAIDWNAYPNHKERLALIDTPTNLGKFCKN